MAKYSSGYISYFDAKRMDERSARKSYTELRDIAQKRLKRAEKAGFTDLDRFQTRFPTLKEIKEKGLDVSKQLQQVSSFVYERGTTLGQIRAEIKQTHEYFKKINFSKRFGGITERNFVEFTKFMEKYRQIAGSQLYDSAQAYDLFMFAQEKNFDAMGIFEHFDFFVNNTKEVLSFNPENASELHSADDWYNAFNS